jgi:hypothetical protein
MRIARRLAIAATTLAVLVAPFEAGRAQSVPGTPGQPPAGAPAEPSRPSSPGAPAVDTKSKADKVLNACDLDPCLSHCPKAGVCKK